jgi:hypothetical protein
VTKSFFQASGVLLAVGLFAAPAFAKNVFRVNFFCDIIFGEEAGGGKGKINGKGDAEFNVKGLETDTAYRCIVFCEENEPFFDEACETDAKGKLKVSFKGAAAGRLCEHPGMAVLDSETLDEVCVSGFDDLP